MTFDLARCTLCPRSCAVDRRTAAAGFCRTPADRPRIASICRHTGEEPVLGGPAGVCNVFFGHCNLQCVYCQNAPISRNDSMANVFDLDAAVTACRRVLADGARALGFVSPSHQIPQMVAIIDALRAEGLAVPVIYNSSAYDSAATLRLLENHVDIWLPDFKYADAGLAARLSGAPDYPLAALRALREMFRQKGSTLDLDEDGLATSGLVIRHLVLPGHVQNSLDCLRIIAEELSPRVHVSLMAQYHPMPGLPPPFDRTLTGEEYAAVTDEFCRLGFTRGWVQELDSHAEHLPDFSVTADPFGIGTSGA